jgi:PST family polysaccharide transporter
MALIVINAVQIILDLGLSQALIAQKEDIEQAASTIFYTILLFSITLCAATVVAAPSIAVIMKQPAVVPILQVLTLNIVVGSLATVPIALMQKAQRWRAQALVEAAPAVASTVTMVVLAYTGFGAWSIVYGHIVRAMTQAAVVWSLVPWRPTKSFHWGYLSQLFSFGKWVVLDRLCSFVFLNADNAYLARYQGATMLGYYALPYNWVTLPVQYLVFQSNRVMFSILSGIQQPEERNHVFLQASRLLSFLLLPLYLFWVFNARVFVEGLFGSRWLPAVPILQWLAIYAIGRALVSGPVGSFYWATCHPELAVYPIWVALLVVGVGLVWSRGAWGAVAVAQLFTVAMYARVVVTLLWFPLYYRMRITDVLRGMLAGMFPALLSSLLTHVVIRQTSAPATPSLLLALLLHANSYLILYGIFSQRDPLAFYRPAAWKQAMEIGVRHGARQ